MITQKKLLLFQRGDTRLIGRDQGRLTGQRNPVEQCVHLALELLELSLQSGSDVSGLRETPFPGHCEHGFDEAEQRGAGAQGFEQRLEIAFDIRARHRLTIQCAIARLTQIIRIALVFSLRPGRRHRLVAAAAQDKAAQRKVCIEIGPGGRIGRRFHPGLDFVVGCHADQPLMAAFAHGEIPFGHRNASGIETVTEPFRDPPLADFPVGQVFGNVGVAFQETLHLCLAGEAATGEAFKGLLHDRGNGFIAHQQFAVPAQLGVFQPGWRMKHPIAVFHTRAHFLNDLALILLPLKLALRRNDGFDELALGRVFELEVEAFRHGTARAQFAPQFPVKLRIAGEAFEIIEDDDVVFLGLRIEIAQQIDHAGAVHKVTAAGNIIGKDGFDRIAFLARVVAATLFLAFQTVAVFGLVMAGNAAVNHGGALGVWLCHGALLWVVALNISALE